MYKSKNQTAQSKRRDVKKLKKKKEQQTKESLINLKRRIDVEKRTAAHKENILHSHIQSIQHVYSFYDEHVFCMCVRHFGWVKEKRSAWVVHWKIYLFKSKARWWPRFAYDNKSVIHILASKQYRMVNNKMRHMIGFNYIIFGHSHLPLLAYTQNIFSLFCS